MNAALPSRLIRSGAALWLGGLLLFPSAARSEPGASQPALATLLQDAPKPHHRFLDGTEANWVDWLDLKDHYANLQKERRDGTWFAALVSQQDGSQHAIQHRFPDSISFADFLERVDPLVEIWARTAEGTPNDFRSKDIRLTALDLAELKHTGRNIPTWITLTFPDPGGQAHRWRVEFSLQAATMAHDALVAYEHLRNQTATMRSILATRDTDDHLSAVAQWEALHRATLRGDLNLRHLPAPPTGETDLFVAYEYEVDRMGRFQGFERVYRESEIEKDLRGGAQQLILRPGWSQTEERVWAFRRVLGDNQLERCLNPLPGRDAVQLRVLQFADDNPQHWNVLEFGEPEILRQSALAQFGLVNASLEKRRKRLAWKKSTVDLYVEPAIAAANIGGGLAGAGFPFGEALRLAYNLAVTPHFLADVPSVDELRDLFLLLAAKKQDPRLAEKAEEWLTPEDLTYLQQRAQELPPETLRMIAESVTEEDLKAMLRLARMQGFDARYRLFVDILSSASRVAGVSNSTFFGQLVNNPYFALNGDISIKNIFAAMIGEKSLIYPNGGSMQDLIERGGMAKEWLQYFDVTVDFRAIANTVHRLKTENLADKELRQPFPYAPRLDDLAAYEIRAFGFPLLIWYKRGLLKADIEAYETAYAYTVIGSKVVEHFATREDFEREILARRVAPLGYVKVRDAGGRLRDSNLAVFARVFPAHRHRGRTGIVLYGMRAYEEYSMLIERERQRFVDYERLLQTGGVIERVVDADDRDRLPAVTFEPRFYHGTDERAARFAQPLAALRELQRLHRLQAWNLAITDADIELATQLSERLRRDDIHVGTKTEPPHLVVDPHGSTYQFRLRVNGAWRTVERTAVIAPPDLKNDLDSARIAREVAAVQRKNLNADTGSIILLNEAIDHQGRTLMGPLVRSPNEASVLGHGLLVEESERSEFLHQLASLPAITRAQLHQARYAGLPLPLDLDRDGAAETIFITIEYPVADAVVANRNIPGREPERLRFERGLLTEIATPRRITHLTYTPYRQEASSVTWVNTGSLTEPQLGDRVAETRTLEINLRAPKHPIHDLHEPRLTKLHLDYALGTASLETYGVLDQPIRTVDPQWVTDRTFGLRGELELARVLPNLASSPDATSPSWNQLLQPVPGVERYQLRPDAGWANVQALQRIDLRFGITNQVFLDRSNFGRETGTIVTDPFDGKRSFTCRTTNSFDDSFHYGLVPTRSQTFDLESGTQLSSTETLSYDPKQRQLVARETDASGGTRRKTWQGGKAEPGLIESALRRTETVRDPAETAFVSRTFDRETDEELSRAVGTYDPGQSLWIIDRLIWYRPGITNRIEQEHRSVGGRLVRTHADETVTRPIYDRTGRITTNQVWLTSVTPPSLLRQESEFEWDNNTCLLTVQTWIDGEPYDRYQARRDREGRLVADSLHDYPNLRYRSEIDYEHGTDRVRESREYVNDRFRLRRLPQPEIQAEEGGLLQPVLLQPAWGLVTTQWFRVGDVWGRLDHAQLHNGSQVRPVEWFPGSAIARVTETVNAAGRVEERIVTDLTAEDHQGIPCDRLVRYRLGPGGCSGVANLETQARGTGLPLFQETADRRMMLQPRSPYGAPLIAVDPHARGGVSLDVDGQYTDHVLSVYQTKTNLVVAPGSHAPEMGLEQLEVDLESLFFHRVIRRSYDAAGNLLEELTGRIPAPKQQASRATLLSAAEKAPLLRRFRYLYQSGWVVEEPETVNGCPK